MKTEKGVIKANTKEINKIVPKVQQKKEEKVDNKSEDSLFSNHILDTFKTETTQVREHTIAYDIRKGTENPKKTYLLAHGASATKNFMKVFATELAKKEPHERIIIVDLPLHGDSIGHFEDIKTVHDYVDIMYNFLELMIKDGTIQGEVNWIGWSMGGSIGLLLDLKGANFDELTLLNSSPVWETIGALLPMVNTNTISPIYYSTFESELTMNISDKDKQEILDNKEMLKTGSPEVMVQDFVGLAPEVYDVREQLENIKAKTLIIGGTQDTIAELKYVDLMNDKIPKSKSIVYDETHSQLIKTQQAEKIVFEMTKYFNTDKHNK